jgi:hypothetical protein
VRAAKNAQSIEALMTSRDGTYEMLKVLSNVLDRLLKIHHRLVGHLRMY